MNPLFARVFGTSTSGSRYGWYVLAGGLVLITVSCGRTCSIEEWLIRLLSALLAIAICAAGYFFLQLPGKTILQAHFRLNRLRKELDPLSITLGAVASSRLNEEKGEFLLTYKFADGNYIVLTVWSDGFTVWSPNWNPGFEKHTEGFEPFMSAINKLHM